MARTQKITSDDKAEAQHSMLRMFYDRRHPAYEDLLVHWQFLDSCYRGGRAWFDDNIFRYFKEGDDEFQQRVARAYRFNHTREVVELVQKYLFKNKPTRNLDEAPETVQAFWKKATRSGANIDQLMRQAAATSSIAGRSAVVIDNNFKVPLDGAGKPRRLTQKEAAQSRSRIYGYVVTAPNILDYAFDEDGDGELLWVKLREIIRDDADPMTSTGLSVNRVRLWTRTYWELYEEVEEKGPGTNETRMNVQLVGQGAHNLGFVPVKFLDHTISEDPYRVPGLIDDIAYLDRAVANYLSSLDAIIQDQTFSQLAIPAQSIVHGDDTFKKVTEMGTKRVFVYDGGAGSSARPIFLAPDPKQAGVILGVINKIINEIYHTIGLAGERTKEDNAVGIDNSSGVAKAYDFERVNSLLLSKASACEAVENWMVDTVLAWAGESPAEENLVTYPISFDVMRLADDLVMSEALAKIEAPIEVRRTQMRQLVQKMLPQLDTETRKKIETSIDDWLEGTDVLMPPTAFGKPATPSRPAAAPSRQGSVTAKTK